MKTKILITLALVILIVSRSVYADDDPLAEATARNAKLRDSLRDNMVQLQTAQNQSALLQTQLDQANATVKDLQTKLDASNATIKQQADDATSAKTATDKAIADATDHIATQDKELAAFVAAIAQWKAYEVKAEGEIAQLRGDNQKLVLQTVDLQRLVDDRQTKNIDLYKTANEILTRYEHFGLGDALAAKEPFLGLTRAKLETLVQGYKDSIAQSESTAPAVTMMTTPKPTP